MWVRLKGGTHPLGLHFFHSLKQRVLLAGRGPNGGHLLHFVHHTMSDEVLQAKKGSEWGFNST